ncbi:MAG: hypothetical protein RIQ37_320, partial [Actinomycetota bacterium]
VETAYSAAMSMLEHQKERPTAIFCASDEMAFGALLAARKLGIAVPQDLSIIGVDGHELGEFYGLTTVSQSPKRQGAKAADMLIEQLENKEDRKKRHKDLFELPFELIERGSVAKLSK